MIEDWKRKLSKKMQQVRGGGSAVYHKEEEAVSLGKEESCESRGGPELTLWKVFSFQILFFLDDLVIIKAFKLLDNWVPFLFFIIYIRI